MEQYIRPMKIKTMFIAKITGIAGVVVGCIIAGIIYFFTDNYFGNNITMAIPIVTGVFFYIMGFIMGLFMNWMSKRVVKFSEKMQEHMYEKEE